MRARSSAHISKKNIRKNIMYTHTLSIKQLDLGETCERAPECRAQTRQTSYLCRPQAHNGQAARAFAARELYRHKMCARSRVCALTINRSRATLLWRCLYIHTSYICNALAHKKPSLVCASAHEIYSIYIHSSLPGHLAIIHTHDEQYTTPHSPANPALSAADDRDARGNGWAFSRRDLYCRFKLANCLKFLL